LSRSALHRRLQRHVISRLPEVGGYKPAKKRFKRYPIGYFHLDFAEVRTAESKLNLFIAIDRTSKFAFVRLEKRAGKMEAAQFLRDLLQALPYRIHTVLTDNGIQFTNRALDAHASAHILDRVCSENGIEHRLTKLRHP
jgi:transposase-like protein